MTQPSLSSDARPKPSCDDEGNVVLREANKQVAHAVRALRTALLPYPEEELLVVRVPTPAQAHLQLERQEQAETHNRDRPSAPHSPHGSPLQERLPRGHAGHEDDCFRAGLVCRRRVGVGRPDRARVGRDCCSLDFDLLNCLSRALVVALSLLLPVSLSVFAPFVPKSRSRNSICPTFDCGRLEKLAWSCMNCWFCAFALRSLMDAAR